MWVICEPISKCPSNDELKNHQILFIYDTCFMHDKSNMGMESCSEFRSIITNIKEGTHIEKVKCNETICIL